MKRLERCLAAAEDWFANLAIVVLVAISLSVCLEVITRYGFNRPLRWVDEYTEYGLLYITFLATTWNLRQGGHIRIELVYERLGARARAWCDVVGALLGTLVSLVLLVFGVVATVSAFERGLHRQSLLETPVWMVLVIIPVGAALLSARYLRILTGHLAALR